MKQNKRQCSKHADYNGHLEDLDVTDNNRSSQHSAPGHQYANAGHADHRRPSLLIGAATTGAAHASRVEVVTFVIPVVALAQLSIL